MRFSGVALHVKDIPVRFLLAVDACAILARPLVLVVDDGLKSLHHVPGSILQDWYGAGDRGVVGEFSTSASVAVPNVPAVSRVHADSALFTLRTDALPRRDTMIEIRECSAND